MLYLDQIKINNLMFKILVVEDDSSLRMIIKNKLLAAGFEPLLAENLIKAIRIINDNPDISLIWLDHFLNIENAENTGSDFIHYLKKTNKNRSIPIVLVSSCLDYKYLGEYLQNGVVHCYSKLNFKLEEIVTDISAITALKLFN